MSYTVRGRIGAAPDPPPITTMKKVGVEESNLDLEEIKLRALRGAKLTAAEHRRLMSWLAVSPIHQQEWDALRVAWTALQEAVPQPNMTNEDAQRLRRAIDRRIHRAGRLVTYATLAAAAVVAVLAIRTTELRELVPAESYATGPAETRTVKLEDGTLVRLASNSELQVTSGPAEREVVLSGRAFFAVARDDGRPFQVHTRSGVVNVLGTRFDVSATTDDVRVVVVDGRVEMDTESGSVRLGAGESAVARVGRAPVAAPVEDVYGTLAWMGRALVFQSTTLESVANEVGARYGVDVTIRDTALSRRRVTAAFEEQTIDEVIAVICAVISATCDVDAAEARVVIGE